MVYRANGHGSSPGEAEAFPCAGTSGNAAAADDAIDTDFEALATGDLAADASVEEVVASPPGQPGTPGGGACGANGNANVAVAALRKKSGF